MFKPEMDADIRAPQGGVSVTLASVETGKSSGAGKKRTSRMKQTTDVRRNKMWWHALRAFFPDMARMRQNRVVTIDHEDPAHAAFDMLRTRIMQRMKQNGWTALAITSPSPGCGKTTVAANLAFSLSNQKNCRTVLVDLDLRRPQVAETLGLKTPSAIEMFLTGRFSLSDVFVRYRNNVAIAANSTPVRLAAELLQSPETAAALRAMREELQPDIVIYDLPPMLAYDDVLAFLPNVDCALLVLGAETSTLAEADQCERELSEHTKVVGVVLNKCQFVPEKYGY